MFFDENLVKIAIFETIFREKFEFYLINRVYKCFYWEILLSYVSKKVWNFLYDILQFFLFFVV